MQLKLSRSNFFFDFAVWRESRLSQNRLVFFMIRMNSSSPISPSPSRSASSIIS